MTDYTERVLTYLGFTVHGKLVDMGDGTHAERVAVGTGTAGSPSGGVQSVQGVSKGTPVTAQAYLSGLPQKNSDDGTFPPPYNPGRGKAAAPGPTR